MENRMTQSENMIMPETGTTLLPTLPMSIDHNAAAGRGEAKASAETRRWTVLRIDDNGNKFVVRGDLEERDAKEIVAEFEARGHKQVYWAEKL